MQIILENIGKRFNRDWIFRKCNYQFQQGNAYSIIGANGSGKSTLLQVIAGYIQQSEGILIYGDESKAQHSISNIQDYISIAAPYLELIEEMTAAEFLEFHCAFKMLTHSIEQILELIGLEKTAGKQIRYFSSGMKQRLKLAQAIFSETPVLLLDEPCTNLDADGIVLYHKLIADYCSDKLIIVSSNDATEYQFCTAQLNITQYK